MEVKNATGQKGVLLSQKKSEKRWRAKYNTSFLGDFWCQKCVFWSSLVEFDRVFKKEADPSLRQDDTFPSIFTLHQILEMSKMENTNRRDFSVVIDTDDDDDINFGDDEKPADASK